MSGATTTDQLACRDCGGQPGTLVCGTCLGVGKSFCRYCGEPAYYCVDSGPGQGDFCDPECHDVWVAENVKKPAAWEYDAP